MFGHRVAGALLRLALGLVCTVVSAPATAGEQARFVATVLPFANPEPPLGSPQSSGDLVVLPDSSLGSVRGSTPLGLLGALLSGALSDGAGSVKIGQGSVTAINNQHLSAPPGAGAANMSNSANVIAISINGINAP